MPKKKKKAEILGLDPNPPEKRAVPSREVLGTSKVQSNYQFTLIKSVRGKLNAKVGDILIFAEDEEGNLIIKIEAQQKKKPEHI